MRRVSQLSRQARWRVMDEGEVHGRHQERLRRLSGPGTPLPHDAQEQERRGRSAGGTSVSPDAQEDRRGRNAGGLVCLMMRRRNAG